MTEPHDIPSSKLTFLKGMKWYIPKFEIGEKIFSVKKDGQNLQADLIMNVFSYS